MKKIDLFTLSLEELKKLKKEEEERVAEILFKVNIGGKLDFRSFINVENSAVISLILNYEYRYRIIKVTYKNKVIYEGIIDNIKGVKELYTIRKKAFRRREKINIEVV